MKDSYTLDIDRAGLHAGFESTVGPTSASSPAWVSTPWVSRPPRGRWEARIGRVHGA